MGDWHVRYLGKRERATETKTFTFERPHDLDYMPGQFVFIAIPPEPHEHEWPEHHFSISSSPTERNVEFTTRMTGHPFKESLDALEEGTVVRIWGPEGEFVVRPGVKKVAYVCGGIGVTPARSTIRWAVDTGAGLDIVLLMGDRDLESTAFREEFDGVKAPNIRVVSVLSRPGSGWSGRSGHVDAQVVRDEIPDRSERTFFVSGPPSMVDALEHMLVSEVGVPTERLKREEFLGYE